MAKTRKEEQRLADQPKVAKLLKDQAARFKAEMSKERELRANVEAEMVKTK